MLPFSSHLPSAGVLPIRRSTRGRATTSASWSWSRAFLGGPHCPPHRQSGGGGLGGGKRGLWLPPTPGVGSLGVRKYPGSDPLLEMPLDGLGKTPYKPHGTCVRAIPSRWGGAGARPRAGLALHAGLDPPLMACRREGPALDAFLVWNPPSAGRDGAGEVGWEAPRSTPSSGTTCPRWSLGAPRHQPAVAQLVSLTDGAGRGGGGRRKSPPLRRRQAKGGWGGGDETIQSTFGVGGGDGRLGVKPVSLSVE